MSDSFLKHKIHTRKVTAETFSAYFMPTKLSMSQ
jgi:hypothetical protein